MLMINCLPAPCSRSAAVIVAAVVCASIDTWTENHEVAFCNDALVVEVWSVVAVVNLAMPSAAQLADPLRRNMLTQVPYLNSSPAMKR